MNPITPYNTQLAAVKLPEYGRNVQVLVDYCMTIPDRTRRNACAHTIVGIMADLYPELGTSADSRPILWDHLARLSGYQLDVDYPYPITSEAETARRPDAMVHTERPMLYKMYGRICEEMIDKACREEDRERRIRLFELCANHMKRCYYQTYPDANEDDNKVIGDMLEYTQGAFMDDIYKVYLYSLPELMDNEQYDPAALIVQVKKKKKKKKKKAAEGL